VADNEGINQNQTVEPGIDRRLQTKLIGETIDAMEECRSFAKWVRDNGLEYVLRRSGLRTLFVPADQGFQAPVSGDPEKFLNRHLLSGAAETFDLSRCHQVKSLAGVPLQVSEGGMRVGGARILRGNVPCTNGVIHLMDAEPQPANANANAS